MPRRPPVITTHIFGDIATATRIESIENARFTSSTRTTVAQNGRQAEPRLRFRRRAAVLAFLVAPEVRVGEIEEVQAARQLHPDDADEVDGEQRRDEPEDESANESVPKGLFGAGAAEDPAP